jgi:hypothetical protein
MKWIILLLIGLLALLSVACNLAKSLAENAVTAIPSLPPATEIVSPTTAILPATETPTPQPPEPIPYYYFVELESEAPPAGSVVILQDILILGPTITDVARSSDTATNIDHALQVMLNDPRNAWTGTDIIITSISFDDGAADVVLEGEYFGAGDVVLIAARYQILLTVFAEASVQTARIVLNGRNIANLGVSHSSQAKSGDYTYTRAEVEAFIAENAYVTP